MTLDRDADPVTATPEQTSPGLSPAQAEATNGTGTPVPEGSPSGGKASANPPTARRGDDRAAYLFEAAALLWPPPARVSSSGPRGEAGAGAGAVPPARVTLRPGVGAASAAAPTSVSLSPGAGATPPPAPPASVSTTFVVLPGLRRPRLLVPISRRPAAGAIGRYGKPSSLKARLATQGLSLLFRSGAGASVLRDRLRVEAPTGSPTIESYLSAVLDREVVVSLYLGSARANRKPVLQLLSPQGETIGYAKIGVNPLTTELVGAERDALVRLGSAGLANLEVPALMHYGTWHDLTVLVISALPVWLRRARLAPGHLERAMGEVAGVDGIVRSPFVTSRYREQLDHRLAAAGDSADRSGLSQGLADLASRAADATLSFGACHGDWSPWNMASTGRGLLVWDWERFSTGVPLGFDALHHWLQAELQPSAVDPRSAAAECVERASSLLAPLGVEAPEAGITALLYLADLATRYLADRQAEAGGRFGRPGEWLIPVFTSRLGRL